MRNKTYKTAEERLDSYLRDLTKEQRKEIEDWKNEKDALKNDARGTLGHVSCLGQFYRFTKKTARQIIQDQDDEAVKEFFSGYEGGKGYKGGLNWYYYYIPGYFRFLNERYFDDDHYPKCVRWILKKKDRYKQGETDKEVVADEHLKKALRHAGSERNKALIMILRDTAARPIEISRANIEDFDKVNNTIALRSKKKIKGQWALRRIRLIQSLPYVQRWLEAHAMKDDEKAPLFYCDPTNNRPYERMQTPAIRKIWRKAQSDAGIKKVISTYRLRHTRLTELSSKLQAPELKVYGGWNNLRMVDTYVHLTDKQVNDRLMEIYGKKVKTEDGKMVLTLMPVQCPYCRTENPHDGDFCSSCKRPISLQSIEAQQKDQDQLKAMVDKQQRQMDLFIKALGAKSKDEMRDILKKAKR